MYVSCLKQMSDSTEFPSRVLIRLITDLDSRFRGFILDNSANKLELQLDNSS